MKCISFDLGLQNTVIRGFSRFKLFIKAWYIIILSKCICTVVVASFYRFSTNSDQRLFSAKLG